jgi:uncharacterized protein involved in outer membrane biogenesis
MKTFQSWFFKILWWLTFVVIVLVIIVLANREWIAKELMVQKIRAATGMEPEIGDFSFGVLNPNVTLGNFKLYNTAEFGGTLFLDMPELHIEYDRAALRRHELHISLMRVNFHEVDVVKNEAGTTNIMSFINTILPRKSGGDGRVVAPMSGCKFTGIDLLNLSIGTVNFVDLKDKRRNRTVAFGIQNQIYTNVVSPANLPGLSGQLWLRGGRIVGLPVNPPIRIASPEPAPTMPRAVTNQVVPR